MAQITITIPDNQISAVRDAIASIYGWDASSGVTKTQFAKDRVADFVRGVCAQYDRRVAKAAAEAALVATPVDIT